MLGEPLLQQKGEGSLTKTELPAVGVGGGSEDLLSSFHLSQPSQGSWQCHRGSGQSQLRVLGRCSQQLPKLQFETWIFF